MSNAMPKETEAEVRKALFREAVAKAADFIEKNPEKFHFHSIYVPSSEEHDRACAIGWIGYFAKMLPGTNINETVDYFGTTDREIYKRFNSIDPSWILSADRCVAALRAAYL